MKTINAKVTFTEEQLRWMQYRAAEEGKSVGQILDRAISLERWFCNQEDSQKKVIVEDGDRLRTVVRK